MQKTGTILNILIGDAQSRIRHGLHVLLEQQAGWKVSGEVKDAQALLDAIRIGCPDLVLLDYELPGMPAKELLTHIHQACPHLRVIFMSGKDELRQMALQAGADIFVYKADPPEKLLELIRGLAADITAGNYKNGLDIKIERKENMNTQLAVQKKRSKRPFIIITVVLLFVLAIVALLIASLRVPILSGYGEVFELKTNQVRWGILFLEDGASAIFRKSSHWIGPVISKEGTLTVENDVSITGPVILFNDGLRLKEKTTVHGSVYLFNGSLAIEQGASIRHNAVLFNGGLTLAQNTSIRGDVILFNGGLALQDKASLRGDGLLFNGFMWIGQEAVTYGESIVFNGGLELAPKAELRNDAILFNGNVHLSPNAQIRGDVVTAKGTARLDSQARIAGKLIEKDENAANWHVVTFFLGHLVRFLVMPVAVILLLMALMFYLGRRTWAGKRH